MTLDLTKPSRELDALVAEKVMGESFRPYAQVLTTFPAKNVPETPFYSRDIAAAWLVVEKLRDDWSKATEGVHGTDDSFERPFDDARFFEALHRHTDRRWPWAFLYVSPLAICVAALKAVSALRTAE